VPRGERAPSSLPVAALAAALLAAPALADDPGRERDPEQELDRVERVLDERQQRELTLEDRSSGLADEIGAVRGQLVDTAAAVQEQEVRLRDSEREIAALESRAAERSVALDKHRAGLESALAGLALLARSPPNALVGRPAEWADTVRGAALLETLVPALRARAERLGRELAALAELRRAQAQAGANLVDARAMLETERARLRRLLERKSSLQATVMGERRRLAGEIAALAAEAEDLRGLVERIAAARAEAEALRLAEIEPAAGAGVAPQLSPPQPPGPTEAAAQLAALPAVPEPPALRGSSLPFPVHGEIVERFGEALAGGGEGLGIRIEASAGAQVVAPRDGEVVFAGPFRSYGRLLILEHDDGYHSLLSGFSRIDSEVGQSVRAGEPVGSVANGAEGASFLYVEIRRDTQPIDPIPWLLSGIRKVNG
jgi:septal ring factor EnvC (AmiA/AmiB activator)